MVLTLPVDTDKSVQADWLPFKAGEVRRHQNVTFYSRSSMYSFFVYYLNSTHSLFIEPYRGYIAMDSAGRKGCESVVLELLKQSGR